MKMAYRDDMEMEIEDLKKQVWKMQSGLKNQMEEITAILPEIQKLASDIKGQLPAIQDSITDITENIIPALEEKIENAGGGGGGSEEWTVIYDKDSPDPAINIGLKNGIMSGGSVLYDLPDLKNFKRLRFKMYYHPYYNYFYMDLFNEANSSSFYLNQVAGVLLVNVTANLVVTTTNQLALYFPTFTMLVFGTNTVSVINLNNNREFYVGKIEVI